MNDNEAIAVAKAYVSEIYADEQVTNIGLEEIEYVRPSGTWLVTLGFSRPWNTARTRAQEILENMGASPSLKRAYKVVTIADDGRVLSMKNWVGTDAAE